MAEKEGEESGKTPAASVGGGAMDPENRVEIGSWRPGTVATMSQERKN